MGENINNYFKESDSKVAYSKFWRQKLDDRSPKLPELQEAYRKEITNKMLDPEDERHAKRSKEVDFKKQKKGEKKRENEDGSNDRIEKVKRDVKECKEVLQNLKSENLEILKINANYVIQNSKKYFTHEKIEPANYKFINDIVRNKLMKEMMNFKPQKHLQNLKGLANNNEEIKNELEKLVKNIDDDINELLDKKYYQKKLKNLRKKKDEKKLEEEYLKNKEKEPNEIKAITNISIKVKNEEKKERLEKSLEQNQRPSNSKVKKIHKKEQEKPGELKKKNAKIEAESVKKKESEMKMYQDMRDQLLKLINDKDPDGESQILKNFFYDSIQKFVKLDKNNPKAPNQFSLNTEHSEFKKFFNLDDVENEEYFIKKYFGFLSITQNSLYQILLKKFNNDPGILQYKAKKDTKDLYLEIKEAIKKSKQNVLSIIPIQTEEETSLPSLQKKTTESKIKFQMSK